MATLILKPGFEQTPKRFRDARFWVVLLAWLASGVHSVVGQTSVTNAAIFNLTPVSFSVLWALGTPIDPSMTPSIAVFADARGLTNLAGQVGVEFYPLDSGDPSLLSSYARRLNRALLRQQTKIRGLVYLRVSGCAPNTTYYYRLQLSNSNGPPVILPSTLPLPGITTARENAFVLQSQQLLVNLAGNNQNGSVVTLSNANAFAGLAAVVSDGAGTNQVFFSINDLVAAAGNTNFPPLGSQQFTAAEAGLLLPAGISQTYSLNFSTVFSLGQINQFSLGSFLTLNLGSTAVRAGSAGGVTIGLGVSGSLTNISFTLSVPTNRLGNLTLLALSPQLGAVGVQSVASNTFLVSIAAAGGQTLQGTQTVAELNFSAVPNQSSGFVPLSPQSTQGTNADGSSAIVSAGQSGRVAVVGAQPLLDVTFDAVTGRSLSLFGIPGTTYQIDYSTNLLRPNNWTGLFSAPMTNLTRVFTGLSANQPAIFYRAHTP